MRIRPFRRASAVSWRAGASPALEQLLQDAAAPAHADELGGLAAALTAFSQTPQPRRNRMTSLLAKLLAAKAALAATGSAVAVSGIALAAATGSLPAPLQTAAHDNLGAPAAASHPTPSESDSPEPSDSATPEPSDSASPEPKGTPSPSLVGLCRAYGAGVATSHGKALDNPAFTVLITTAGGKDAVPAYCATLLAGAPGGKPTALPTHAQGHQPATHPTGKPASHPTGKPATHPTGKP